MWVSIHNYLFFYIFVYLFIVYLVYRLLDVVMNDTHIDMVQK